MGFKYQARSEDAWKKRADQQGSQFDSYTRDEFKNYTLRNGDNIVRVLPPTWENPKHYGFDVWVHYSVGPNKGTVLCLNKMKNQKCPVCEAHTRAEMAGREDAKDLKPGRRVLTWVLDRKEETSPLLWAMPWTVDREISQVCRDRQTGELYQIDHPEAGFDISFDRTGKDLQTKYSGFQLARRPSSVHEQHLKFIDAHPLPDTLLWRDYDEVKYLFEGEAPEVASSSTPPAQEASDPQPTVKEAAPQKTTPCDFSTKIKGEKYICLLSAGHKEEHDLAVEPALALTPQEFCGATIAVRGVTYGCGIIGEGHKGDHDFSREIPVSGKAETPPVIKNTSAGSARASAMKSRFETGQK